MLTRGTVHDPTTRRMGGVAGHAGVFSTAHDVSLFAQALLDRLAGRPSNFPLLQSTLQSHDHTRAARSLRWTTCACQQPPQNNPPSCTEKRVQLRCSHRATPRSTDRICVATAGTSTPPSPSPAAYFSPSAASAIPASPAPHSGWSPAPTPMSSCSPGARFIHRGNTFRSPTLRGEVATAVAQALQLYLTAETTQNPGDLPQTELPTLAGIDVLESDHFAELTTLAAQHNNPLRLGIFTNQSGVDAHGRRTIDILSTDVPNDYSRLRKLTIIFSPEHGIFGAHDTRRHFRAPETDPTTGLRGHLPLRSP